jgi:hypothetical protein
MNRRCHEDWARRRRRRCDLHEAAVAVAASLQPLLLDSFLVEKEEEDWEL